MGMREAGKKNILARMLYYGGKAAMAEYYRARAAKFLDTQRKGNPWNGKLPYQLRDQYVFEDRRKNTGQLCMILAGYKPELWDAVFGRIHRFAPGTLDICVMSSGLYRKELSELCQRFGWSYLSTKKNKLTRIQNLAIYLHPWAKEIYKLDEDIFVTEGYFDVLQRTYEEAEKNLAYEIAFAAPLIPVNGYGYVRVLEKTGLQRDWETRFGKAVYTDGNHHHTAVLELADAARYLWGETQPVLRDIDELSARFQNEPFSYTVCPIRFSIGAILFRRDTWLEMGMFQVDWTAGMGLDEEQLAEFCMLQGRATVVSENIVVGHLGYGPQTKELTADFLEGKIQANI